MEEGVKHADNFVLFLTSDHPAEPPAPAGAAETAASGGASGPASPASAGGGGSSGAEKFKTVVQELKELLEEGYLTAEEFKHAKEKAFRDFIAD